VKLTPAARAARIALIYLVFGTFWIVGSDTMLGWLVSDATSLTYLQSVKGAVFVLVTGAVFYYLGHREIKRQYEADREARARERALESLFEVTFDHAAVGMAHSSLEGRFLRVNRAYCDMVGYSQDELSTLKYQDITHPDDLARDEEQTKRMLAGEFDSFTMDKRFIRKDGTVVWATLMSSIVPGANGNEDYYIAAITDISDRKAAEGALRASESKFRALVEQSIVGIYVFDQDGFRYVNRRLAEMFGYSEDELIDHMSPPDLIAPEDQGAVKAQIRRRLDGSVPSAHYTARGLRKDGTKIWLELHGTRMGVDERQAITGMALDVTERVQSEQRIRDSEARFRAIYEGVNDAILIVDPATGVILDVNRKAIEMGGYSAEEVRRLTIPDVSAGDPREVQAAVDKRIEAAMRGKPQIFEWEVRDRGGLTFWTEINMRSARIDGVNRILVLARDISERRASEEQLRLAGQVFTSTREGVVVTDTENRILSVNPAFTEITGYSEEEVLGKTPKLLQSGFHDRLFYQGIWQSITRTNHWQGEIWNRRKSGEPYPEWLTISAVHDERGKVTNYVGVFTDVSRIKHSEAEVQRLAHYDPLTNFPNRVLLMSRLEHAIDLGRRRGKRIALAFCGLDRFKYINDSFGYGAGDELLQTVSRRIRSVLQNEDTLARFGGDEFVVLIESDHEPEEIAQVAQAIVALGETSIELSTGQMVFAGISVGVGIFPTDADDAAALITNANAAMQQAKIEGRHTYRFYTEGLTEAARERLQMEARLRHAVESNQFELYYQPMMEVPGGRIIGAEALVRWHDPENGIVGPDRFIPVAEDTGLIVPLGHWVLETACKQAARWKSAGFDELNIAVNLSSRQFETGDLKREVALVLEDTGLDPDRLELEITESVLMEHGERSIEMLNGLREIGVRVSIDDFGTGYSSLAYLKRFAINKFKIDRIFIKELPGNREDAEIVSTMIGMAHNLNLQVVAEGVETPSQLEFLKAQGCDEFQGYLMSPPVPAADFEALVQEPRRAAEASE
jgi:diguanylate cyclase (GGDEF)-like protein/PAS domain S-box-containing protein